MVDGVSESEHNAILAVIEACVPSHIMGEIFLGPLMTSGPRWGRICGDQKNKMDHQRPVTGRGDPSAC